MSSKTFMECDTCRAKTGSPILCEGCLNNRSLIHELGIELYFFRKIIEALINNRRIYE